MKSTTIAILLIILLLAGSVSAQQRITDYSQVNRLRWMGSEPPDTYAEYLAKHLPRPIQIVPLRTAPLRTPLAAGPPRVLVFVNSSLLSDIQTNVDRYILDIEGQGYAVDLYSSTHGTAEDLKAFIVSQSTDLVGCVLIGDLPCAWYEIENDYGEDGYKSFPCDLYLMDLDGNWQDLETTYPMQSGVYDTHSGSGSSDTAPEIFLGRIDASQMSGDAEDIQVNAYLDKLHEWYSSQLPMTNYALTYTEDDWASYSDFWMDIADAYPENEAIIAPATDRYDYANNRLTYPIYQFIQLACHSGPTNHAFTRGGDLTSYQIKVIPPRALFYNLFCCSAQRFTYPDFLGGAYIFNPSTTSLATIGSSKTGSMLQFWAFYQPLGQGKTLGQAFSDWFNTIAPYSDSEISWHYGMTIMGDPMIVPVVSDPSEIVLFQPNGGDVLSAGEQFEIQWWTRSPQADSINVLLSLDSGDTYPYTVASGLPGASTSYLWTVGEYPISLSKIKVEYWDGGIVEDYDVSDGDFVIQSGPYRYASPTGGDIYPYAIPMWAAHSIQDAVDASDPGDSILVAEGTYSENVVVSSALHIMGGWDSGFTVRDRETYESHIQRSGSCVSFMNLGTDYCGIEGMTIANGSGTSLSMPTLGNYGGGIFAYNSSPLIKENTFVNCGTASVLDFSGGGAISVYGGHAVIENNEITACKAQAGGGVYLYMATADIIGNRITGSYGNFEYIGTKGGGGVYAYHAGFTMEDNVISGCYDYKYGGAVYARFSQASLSGDSLYSNSVESSGGAVNAERDTMTLSGVVIRGNSSGTFGGGIYGKAAYFEIENTIVTKNNGMLGGGIYPDSCTGEMTSNTFDRNTAAFSGGGMYLQGPGALDMRNNIFSYSSPYGVVALDLSTHTYLYNNCYGNSPDEHSGPAPDSTNIYADPHYSDTTAYDYHLLVHSASIDAGDPDLVYNDPDGSRADQGAFGGPAAVMAALEYVKNASAVAPNDTTIQITWDEMVDPSLAYYVIYGDTSAGFVPDELLMLGTVSAGTESFDHHPVTECWYYRVSAVNALDLGGGYSSESSECGSPPVGDEPEVPSFVNRLEQNFPNPFNGTTTIAYSIESKSAVDIRIYDTAGRLIKILEQKSVEPGRYETIWRGVDNADRAVASGIYFCRIKTGSFSQTRKIVYLR